VTNGNSERLGKASGPTRRLLALLVGLLAAVALIASGAPSAAAQNAVGPQPGAMILTVGPQSPTAQTSIGADGLPLRQLVSVTGVAAETADGAANAANGVRLGQQLARESANSAFTSSGELSSGAIGDSNLIIPGSRIGNPDVIKSLTSDGSDISDWGKYTTRSYQSPSGDFQVHYYMNRTTGAVNYGSDYKVVFNGSPP
jgi:hypothetical protein